MAAQDAKPKPPGGPEKPPPPMMLVIGLVLLVGGMLWMAYGIITEPPDPDAGKPKKHGGH